MNHKNEGDAELDANGFERMNIRGVYEARLTHRLERVQWL